MFLTMDEMHLVERLAAEPVAQLMDGHVRPSHCNRLSRLTATCVTSIRGPQPSRWRFHIRETPKGWLVSARLIDVEAL